MFKRYAKILLVQEIVRPDSKEEFLEKLEYPQRLVLPNYRALDVAINAYEQEVKNYQLKLVEYRELNKEFKKKELAL